VISSSQPLPTRHRTNTRYVQPCTQRDSKPRSQNQAATDLHLRPQGHRDRLKCNQSNVTAATEAYVTCIVFVNAGLRFAAAAAYLEITVRQWIGDAEAVWREL
jgi:hypothetical protein